MSVQNAAEFVHDTWNMFRIDIASPKASIQELFIWSRGWTDALVIERF